MSDFNLEGFKSNFGDGARGNLFYYIPNFPDGVTAKDITTEKSKFLVKATSLPATTLEEVTVNWQGYDFKYAGKHTFSDFAVTFNVDIKAGIRMTFENWVNLAHNPETNIYGEFKTYMKNQTLQLLGFNGNVIMEYTLFDAWPKEIAAVTLDYSATDIATFDVTFTYSYHTIKQSGTGN